VALGLVTAVMHGDECDLEGIDDPLLILRALSGMTAGIVETLCNAGSIDPQKFWRGFCLDWQRTL
jgi:hypothetical protein